MKKIRMKEIFSRLAKISFPGTDTLIANFCILAFSYGQFKSARTRMSVDALGRELPWYTYPAIAYLESFNFKNCNVFEFGSGNSSFWWAKKARHVISIEDNLDWFKIVDKKKKKNQLIIHQSDKVGYVNAIKVQKKLFEIIVIDGNWRLDCTKMAIRHLKNHGVIILDNSDRKQELTCGKILRENGFFQIDFSGFGPINGYCWSTSLFMKNSQSLQDNFTGPSPIGGLNNYKTAV